jgi:hypothetical protein
MEDAIAVALWTLKFMLFSLVAYILAYWIVK